MNSTRLTTFTRDGLTFHVTDQGPLDGPPVVLLHGFPQDQSSWSKVLPALNDAGLRTLTFDQRGYDRSATPLRVKDYALDELAADVIALADAANLDHFHLVGHDWGGGVAWQVAATAPERLESLTVLSTPHPAAMSRAFRASDQARRSWYMGAFQVPRLPEAVLSRNFTRFMAKAGLPGPEAYRYAERFSTPESLRGPINWYRALNPLHGTRENLGAVGDSTVPTTYIWGSRDVALGREAAEDTANHVTADYRFVELDASHWLPEEKSVEVAEEIVKRVHV